MTLLKSKIKFFVFALTFALLLACSNEDIFARKKTLRFKDYPATQIYKGKNAPLKLTRDDKMFRTRLNFSLRGGGFAPRQLGRWMAVEFFHGYNPVGG